VLKLPVMRHHLVVYGAALHKAVEAFYKRQLQGQPIRQEELLGVFERAWRSEGFLTREHEELRLAQGHSVLIRFFAQQQAHPEQPAMIEQPFKFLLDDLLIVGRWDRVDRYGEDAVIIDYKSTDIRDQAAANRRTKESLQLLVYALAWHTLEGRVPVRVELRFLESGLTGQAVVTEDDLDRARAFLRQAGQGIRAYKFPATPDEHNCRWCAFQAICPFAFKGILTPR
jgi:DNA helicase-2/ATP-dependent DNA helicase PcrA